MRDLQYTKKHKPAKHKPAKHKPAKHKPAKHKPAVAMITLIALMLSAFIISLAYGNPMNELKSRDQLWKEVETAQKQRLPKTEMKLLGQIYDLAIAEEAFPDAARALFQKIVAEAKINQSAPSFAIKKLQSEIQSVPPTLKPIADAVLANWTYAYFQNNRWRFQQRSQTSTQVSDDIETWDLRRILQAVDQSFLSALESADELKKIPIGDYDQLTENGNKAGDARRPTVYDFIAHQALQFYSLDEQITRGVDNFHITADSPIFSDDKQFLTWKPATKDTDSYALKAIGLYQQLMVFHQGDEDQTAYLAADLERLSFGNREAKGQEKTARFRSALQRFSDQHKQHPVSADALSNLAQSYSAQSDFVEAHRIATIGLNRFKESTGGAACQNLIASIERSSASILTERIWNAAKPEFSIAYKNVDQITFRVVKYSRDRWKTEFRIRSTGTEKKNRNDLLRLPVVKQWTVDLAATDDFQMRMQSITTPDDLEKGAYLIVGLVDSQKNKDDDGVLFAKQFWQTDIGHVTRTDYSNRLLSGQIFNSVTGRPIGGARIKVQSAIYVGREQRFDDFADLVTDADGNYSVQGKKNCSHHLTITNGDDTLYVIDNTHRQDHSDSNRQILRANCFTDRSIYRPGQTIHFKVVCTSSDTQNAKYVVSPNETLTVDLIDVNGEVVETLKLKTNEFGSASGSVTAPQDRATGNMQLRARSDSNHSGQAGISVEEYKRPKFKVDIDKPEKSFALNDAVTITGHAMAYNGAAIDGAKVTYRVVRGVRYASWWYWRSWWAPAGLPEKEITQGTQETKIDGSFEIKFDAIPDPAADRQGQPTFSYQVFADVTDSSGETRSARTSINVGFVSLTASVGQEGWLTPDSPVKFSVKTQTLDGVGQAATGKLIVRKLTPPENVQRNSLGSHHSFTSVRRSKEDKPDLSDYRRWPAGEIIAQHEITTDEKGDAEHPFKVEAGAFRVTFETTDPGGEKVSAESNFLVVDPSSKTFPIKIPEYFAAREYTCQPGETFTAVWGTGYETGAAFVEVFHRKQRVNSFWTDAGDDEGATQKKIEIPIEEKHRGGLYVVVTYVRENRLYSHTVSIGVPWNNKRLKVKWEHFVSKLQPGGKETWTAVVSGPDAESSAVEMVAAMYDSSLDQFQPHQWATRMGAFYTDYLHKVYQFNNQLLPLDRLGRFGYGSRRSENVRYRRFARSIQFASAQRYSRGVRTMNFQGAEGAIGDYENSAAESMPRALQMSKSQASAYGGESDESDASEPYFEENESSDQSGGGPDLAKVSIRKNLQETAFFYPNLIADSEGRIKIEFEVPEALTTWKFMGMAHDADLRTGMLTDEMTTSKDLMVQPNPPRFLREGDELYFSAKVTNQSDSAQTGVVQLQLGNAFDESSVDDAFGNSDSKKTFSVPAKESRSYHWKLKVPDYVGAISYKVVGASETVSDGEEGLLPVLSKRILVTESLPLPIRGNQTRTFTFDELEKMDRSDSLKSEALTVQMTSNPSWYAVMALPYLMEYPHQCSEQTFNRLYANALGQKIVTSNPRIKTIFEQWRGTDAFMSPLEKNDELRNVTIAESPWLIDGKDESQARRNVGLLFDANRLNREIKKSTDRLAQMQLPDGSWPWFSGGPSNEYLTLYITTGFGRLRKLGVEVDVQSAIRSLSRLDDDLKRQYDRLVDRKELNGNNLSSRTALYLYGRSFFLKDQGISDQNRTAYDYFVGQAKTYWAKLGSRQSQAHIAIAMKRLGNPDTANAIMKSLTERSQRDDELGQFWDRSDNFWFWYQAPVETQALLIEAYDEVLGDAESVEECKIWLLKQKQTQAWKTTKSTADAVYALLLRGTDSLASSKLVGVTIGGKKIQPDKVEAGTGFFEERFTGSDITSKQKTIEVVKSDDGIAWGSVHWQYLEDVSKIQPYEGTPLTIKKALFIKKNTDNGPEISPVTGPVEIGDELVTRVEIRVDRDMEFVHLKDYRGSGTEPVSVLSRYKNRDGLWYYESTRDTASHFFIDYLRKGTYVFETSVRVQHAGTYETGIAELQCMYAPEFNSHSGSVEIKVKPAK